MNTNYRIAVNVELTSKCNAKCVMCPRHLVKPKVMKMETFDKVLSRLEKKDVFRAVLAGYGEPTTHPYFEEMLEKIATHPVNFDMVTNGEKLDLQRLQKIDGSVGALVMSFSSIDTKTYESVHVALDHQKVMENIALAAKTLKKTTLAISLTPLKNCLDTLPETIKWLRSVGVKVLTMSPTLYDRAGGQDDHKLATKRLRAMIKKYQLHSQELDFIPSLTESLMQKVKNKFSCSARNSDMLISASGEYMYCFNDISHTEKLANIEELSLRQAINKREKMPPCPSICTDCNMLERYNLVESISVASSFLKERLIARLKPLPQME